MRKLLIAVGLSLLFPLAAFANAEPVVPNVTPPTTQTCPIPNTSTYEEGRATLAKEGIYELAVITLADGFVVVWDLRGRVPGDNKQVFMAVGFHPDGCFAGVMKFLNEQELYDQLGLVVASR